MPPWKEEGTRGFKGVPDGGEPGPEGSQCPWRGEGPTEDRNPGGRKNMENREGLWRVEEGILYG